MNAEPAPLHAGSVGPETRPGPPAVDDAAGAGDGSRDRRVRGLARSLAAQNLTWISLVLVVLVAGFSVAAPGKFLTGFNVQNICIDASVLLVLSVGQTYVILTAGIDLSVGAVLVLAGVVAARVMGTMGGASAGWSAVLLGLAVALGVGAVAGIFNGALIAWPRIPPLIVTLATLGIALGLAEVIAGGQDIRTVPAVLSDTIGFGNVLGPIPWLVFIAAVISAVGAAVLRFTRFGCYVKAIGSSHETCLRLGIPVGLELLKVYAITGVLAGLAGWLSLAQFSTTTLSGHSTDNLAAITAVVLGGTSLFGGRGSVVGTIVGVFVPVVLSAGLVILDVPTYWQGVAIGFVLLGAVYADRTQRPRR